MDDKPFYLNFLLDWELLTFKFCLNRILFFLILSAFGGAGMIIEGSSCSWFIFSFLLLLLRDPSAYLYIFFKWLFFIPAFDIFFILYISILIIIFVICNNTYYLNLLYFTNDAIQNDWESASQFNKETFSFVNISRECKIHNCIRVRSFPSKHH